MFYTANIALLVLAGCTAATGVIFFFMAASRAGNPSAHNFGSGSRSAIATPAQMFAMSAIVVLFAIGMYVGSVYSKRGQRTAEIEYEEFVGKPFVRGENETVF